MNIARKIMAAAFVALLSLGAVACSAEGDVGEDGANVNVEGEGEGGEGEGEGD